jgi:glycosyltransferase involved in cell wall biosynthesis
MVKVSINTITHNRAPLLKEAIESVLSQSYTDWEYIIIDDASTDNTEEVVKSFNDNRIIYKKVQKQRNISAARNLCLNKSQGKYIAILDSDDIWCDKDKLKEQVEFLDNNPDYVIIGTGSIFINHEGEKLYKFLNPENDKEIRNVILGRCVFTHCNVLFKNNLVIYSLDPKTLHVEDYRLYLDLGKFGKFKNLPKYATKIRETNTQLSKINRKKQTKESLYLTKLYKKEYPNFAKNLFRAWLRHLIYGKLNFIFLYSITAKIKDVINKRKL